ncbi:MAG: hypothetical protein V7K64_03270 [Nostoc sp.]|uniref:hypothetical protein n=1 Tax=unclassified Nostoc TaxID=2593658 RepID=UPI001DE15B5C|nr:hypothetical protein [Nostoc sp. JL34]MBN3886191.1 hypothetical protein [Nostoc sp. JL34]
MRDYTADSQGQTGIPQEQAIALMLAKYENVTALLDGFDYSPFFTGTPTVCVSSPPQWIIFWGWKMDNSSLSKL